MNKFLVKLGGLPIGNLIDYLVVLALTICLLLLSGCATTEKMENPTNQMDARSAQALALAKIGESATDGETKRLALVMVAMLGNSQSPNPQIAAPRTVGEAVLTFLDRSTERLFSIVPAYLSYRGQVRQSQTTEVVAGINRDVSVNQSNNFLAIGAAGIQGTTQVGIAGVTSLAGVASSPRPPSTSIVLTGNSGPVNLGSGTQTNSSNNPVNPGPVVCVL